MTFKTVIKDIIKSQGYTQEEFTAEIQQRFGEAAPKNREAVTMSMKRNNPKLETILQYAETLGFELRLVPKGTKMTEGTRLLDGKDLPQALSD